MATKAKTTSKKTTRPASGAAARTTKKSTSVKAKVVAKSSAAPVAAQLKPIKPTRFIDDLSGTQVLGEMLGTFLLVCLVAATGGNAFLIGIGLIVITTVFFSVSGAHLNPAVTFGLFAMRKLSASKMLFYWMAQFVGAISAIVVSNAFAGERLGVSLASFLQWDWAVVAAEFVAATIFMLGVAAAVNRGQSDTERSLGIGIALYVALLISSNFLQQAATASAAKTESTEPQRIAKLSGTTANPAVALSLKESEANVSQLTDDTKKKDTVAPSRLTLETIVGTLAGAALGGRLYMLIGDRRQAK